MWPIITNGRELLQCNSTIASVPKVKSEKKVGFMLDPPVLDKDTNSKAKTKVKPEVNRKGQMGHPF